MTSKEKRWQRLREEVNHLVDKLDHPVDEGIKDLVTALHAHSFGTSGSCQGHPGEKHGLPYPWVDIETPEPKNWKGNKKVTDAWRKKNLALQVKLTRLLERFYRERRCPYAVTIMYESNLFLGNMRLRNIASDTLQLLPVKRQHQEYLLHKQEMDDFTEFLKREYFLA